MAVHHFLKLLVYTLPDLALWDIKRSWWWLDGFISFYTIFYFRQPPCSQQVWQPIPNGHLHNEICILKIKKYSKRKAPYDWGHNTSMKAKRLVSKQGLQLLSCFYFHLCRWRKFLFYMCLQKVEVKVKFSSLFLSCKNTLPFYFKCRTSFLFLRGKNLTLLFFLQTFLNISVICFFV